MHLASVRIRNYRLLVDAELEVDSATTLIVGRNNTAKTSLFSFIKGILEGGPFGFDDYGCAGKVGVSRPVEVPPWAARADGNSGWPGIGPSPESWNLIGHATPPPPFPQAPCSR